MPTEPKRPGAHPFIAFEVSLEIVASLRGVVKVIRKHDGKLADQIVAAASSVAANLAEGSRRMGRDRTYLYRVAAGSADETRAHLRVALAWGFVDPAEIGPALQLIDRELRMLWPLTR